MAKTNQAKNIADVPNPDEDPISELSDIMKFDPVEAAIEEADATLEIDLENELMGDLSVVEDEPAAPPVEQETEPEVGLTGIPGLDDPVEIADPVEAVQDDVAPVAEEITPTDEIIPADIASVAEEAVPVDDDIDGAFDTVFDESLEDVDLDDQPVAEPTVPQALESQLNDLLAGLGGKDEAPEVEAVSADEIAAEQPVPGEAVGDVLPELVVADLEEDLSSDAAKPEEPVADVADEAEADPTVDADREPDPLESLIGITANFETQISETKSSDVEHSPQPEPEESEVSVSPEAQSAVADESDPAPLVETADIVDEAVPLDDDLDIPDVAFENDVPKAPDFEDLDEEFTKAFSKLTDFDNVKQEQPATESAMSSKDAPNEVAVDAQPHLGEKLDDIFAEMSEKIAPAGSASQAGVAAFDGSADDTPQWTGTSGKELDEPFMASPPPPIGADVDPALAQTGDGGGAKRGILIAAIVAAIAVAGGIGAFALSFGGGDNTQAPALVKADDGPVKVKPKDPGGKTVPNEDKKVYERVAGTGEDETLTQEKLISTTEEPVNVATEQTAEVVVNSAEPRVVLPDPSAGANDAEAVVSEKPAEAVPAEKNDDRILPEVERAVGAPVEELVAVKPRRVKTLIVRPDGTLVPREDPVAEVANELRTGNAEEVQTTEAESAPAAGTPEPAPQPTEVAVVTEEANREVTFQAPAADEAVVVDGGSEAAAEGVVVEGIPVPTPAPRAEFEAQQVAAAETRQPEPAASELQPAETTAEPEVAAADPAPAAAAAPEWWVQISSQPSRASAQASYAELANRHGSIIGGRGVNIVRAEIEGKGTYYRVRVAGGSRSEAAQLCSRLKSAGAGCFIAR